MTPKVDDTAADLDWDVSTDADLDLVLTVVDDETNELVDLDSYTYEGVVKVDADSTDVVLELTGAGSAAGQITVSVAHADNTLPEGRYVWSLWQTSPKRVPEFEGTMRVYRSVPTWA